MIIDKYKLQLFIKKNLLLIILLGVIFSIGYYLRSYNTIHHTLPYSPYEAYDANASLEGDDGHVFFSNQTIKYPTKLIIKQYTDKLFGDFYIIYLLGFIAMFLLGQEFTNKNSGGVLAVMLYAVSPENLLQYTRNIQINDSGLTYVMIFFSILFITKHIKSAKNIYLYLFLVATAIALTSYHTGSTAMVVIFFGLMISLLYSKKITLKSLMALLSAFSFYFIWILLWNKLGPATQEQANQLTTIKGTIININWGILLAVLSIGLLMGFIIYRLKENQLKKIQTKKIPITTVLIASLLIFSSWSIFNFLLKLGVDHYYISTTTLNNSFAQIIITHSYIVVLLPFLFKKNIDINGTILKGWLIGVIIITIGLIASGFYSRIPDYSFPLVFILFAIYWTREIKLRKVIVVGTFIILMISQIIIFNDPFSMRRYYNKNEISSVNKIIDLDIKGILLSDLRTSALFKYLGKDDVLFSLSEDIIHNTIFYDYKNIEENIPENIKENIYVVLSQSMKQIVYATNFQTQPIDNNIFIYYNNRFPQVYNDGLMTIYQIYSPSN